VPLAAMIERNARAAAAGLISAESGAATPLRVGIIGAGAAGLAAAYDLARAGHRVVVFEAAPSVGGLAAGFKAEHWDWTLEKFYHHWFASDAEILKLAGELGVRDRVLFPRPLTMLYYEGQFYQFDSITSALRYPGLGWGADKVRFGLVGLYLRFTKNWRRLEGVTADAWMRRWAGDRVYRSMWEPLMISKFGERYAKQVNMAWLWARLHARTPRLGTFVGGFQAFMDVLADGARRAGAEIRLGVGVREIAAVESGVTLATANGPATFDRLLSTTSPALFAKMAPQLPAAYRARLDELKSMGAVVMVLSLSHQLTPRGYWHNLPKDAGFPFLALVEHTNYLSPEHYGGDHIVYCGDYLEPDHPYFDIEKEALWAIYRPALQRFNPRFEDSWVHQTWLFRTRYAQPVPFVNHSRHVPDLKTPLPNVWLASMSQVYPWDRGTNFAVEIGRRAARRMLSE
jgi:protoporphyrinogen oxidase